MILKKEISLILVFFIAVSSLATMPFVLGKSTYQSEIEFIVQEFRYLEEECEDNAIFWLECQVEEDVYQSPDWDAALIGKPIDWSFSLVPSPSEKYLNLTIRLYKTIDGEDILCDLSGNKTNSLPTVNIVYDLNTGWWTGDDSHGDPSGYGRVNGCDDGSIYDNEDDAEVFFTILQQDEDGDHIPSWIETNIYGTDPTVDDLGTDYDKDGVASEWEWYFGYHPTEYEPHEELDDDIDSITNVEEYQTWKLYGSDPFRQDVFLEIDWMEESVDGIKSVVPEKALERIKEPFHRRNIVFHFDVGKENGGEIIPFTEKTSQKEVLNIYQEYFLHNGTYEERRSIFHYAIVVYLCDMKGYAFSGDTPPYWGYIPGTNGFVISSSQMERNTQKIIFKDRSLDNFYGSAMMHEMGHNFGIRFGEPFGCDNWFAKYPWQPMFWLIRNYKSMMNYQYTYRIFDYSDGTHGWGDYDDWANIDLTYFEQP